MNIITIATMKGGTGKTTLTYNMSAGLASTGANVLAMDFDPQCNLSSNFNFDIFNESAPSVADIFEDINTDPWSILLPTPLKECGTLDIIPSTMYLYGTELNLSTRAMREQALTNYIYQHQDFFGCYDYILIDTGPNMGIINQNAFFASDHIVLVLDPSCNSAKGAHVFLSLWDRAREYSRIEDHVDALVINNVERTNISNALIEYIDGHPVLSKIRMKSMLPHTTRFKECDNQNLPIQFLKTKNAKAEESRQKAELALNNLIEEFKERGIL